MSSVRKVKNLLRNLKKEYLGRPVYEGRDASIDFESILVDTEGAVEFSTKEFNPFGDRSEDFLEDLRPIEAVRVLDEVSTHAKELRQPRLTLVMYSEKLTYSMRFVDKDNQNFRASMRGILEEEIDIEEVETICGRYGIHRNMDGWNSEFDDVGSFDDYTNLTEESYHVGLEQLQNGIISGEIRKVRYLGEQYDDLTDEELMSILLGENMIPESIMISEHQSGEQTLYDVRVCEYDGHKDVDFEITISGRSDIFEPVDEDEIYHTALDES